MGLFSCFSRVFCVRQGKKILGRFEGFPWLKQNNQGKEGQGNLLKLRSLGSLTPFFLSDNSIWGE